MKQTLFKYITDLSGGKNRIIVYVTPGQIRDFRQHFTVLEWAGMRRACHGDPDHRNVAMYDNILLRVKETQEHPTEIDISEGIPEFGLLPGEKLS